MKKKKNNSKDLGPGKTRTQQNEDTAKRGPGKTHRGGNIADVTFVADTKNVSANLQKRFLWPRGAQQCCRVLPRTGNIVGHNVPATMYPRFAGALVHTK